MPHQALPACREEIFRYARGEAPAVGGGVVPLPFRDGVSGYEYSYLGFSTGSIHHQRLVLSGLTMRTVDVLGAGLSPLDWLHLLQHIRRFSSLSCPPFRISEHVVRLGTCRCSGYLVVEFSIGLGRCSGRVLSHGRTCGTLARTPRTSPAQGRPSVSPCSRCRRLPICPWLPARPVGFRV